MSYTPNILIRKDEFDNALKKEFKKYYNKKCGWFDAYKNNVEVEHKLKNLLHKNGIELIDGLNHLDSLNFMKYNVHEIEGQQYYWFWTEFSSETHELLKFLEKHNVTRILQH